MIDQIIENIVIDPQHAADLARVPSSDRCVKFIDCSFELPNSGENAKDNYAKSLIEGAVFFDIHDICNKNSGLPHMLPDRDLFQQKLSELGIATDDLLILYGQRGILMGPARVWWMFRGFGHRHVVILNGGLPAWKKCGLPTTNTPSPCPLDGGYIAHDFNRSFIVNLQDVKRHSALKSSRVIDARPYTRFSGQSPEPRAGMRSGHIPNSVSIPCSTLVTSEGMLKGEDELRDVFSSLNLTADNKVICSCGSGITACALFVALSILGHGNISVYDGSWSEWGHKDSPTDVATLCEIKGENGAIDGA